ncbi:hypothetical protein IWW54_006003 [Coemansia sp. RSA 2705]|nr:hypothetical protein IWW54_006003 [Coemansia sp. RSA 2705]
MDDEGPAFLSFSGLPDEDVHDFVGNVEALRKHFKWSNQVTFCYARTMLKGSARKTVQGARAAEPKGKSLDEAVDPASWSNLKSALVFEFSAQYAQDRELVQLLTTRQQAGESGSEYAQRFVALVSALVVAHPLDSTLLATLFATGLRSEKLRWELLLRRLNTIDKAVGYVAPDQLYKVAKLSALLSPLPLPSAVDSVGELSPASEMSATFAAAQAAGSYVDEADELSLREVYGAAADGPDPDAARSSTANGASFALDNDDDDDDDDADPSPWPQPEPGYWTPPRLPNAQQRRQHRQNMTAHARLASAAAHSSASLSNLPDDSSWARHPRSGSFTPSRHAATLFHNMDDDVFGQQPSKSGSETDDQTKSASELNSLADQLESLSSMLRTQSDARRRRPRLCYRCRQKGHIAADCPLPPDMAVPNQQTREKMGLAKPLSRSNTVSAASALSWRAGPHTHSRESSASYAPTQARRYTQSWGRNHHPQNVN